MSDLNEDVCVICRKNIPENADRNSWSLVSDSGLKSLEHFSFMRKDSDLNKYLSTIPKSVRVHGNCRKQFTCKRRLQQLQNADVPEGEELAPKKLLRSSLASPFSWKDHCVLCGDYCVYDPKNPKTSFGENRKESSECMTKEFHHSLKERCLKRDDEWGVEVLGRLNDCFDLIAAEAVYHRKCYIAFCNTNVRSRPTDNSQFMSNSKFGRPVHEAKMNAFDTLCSWLELTDNDLYSLDELHVRMCELAGDDDQVYTKPHMKTKLQEKYGDHIVFAELAGKSNVLCFKNMASNVISEKWYSEREASIQDESLRVVIAASKLIKAQIREMNFDMEHYPSTDSFDQVESAEAWVPSLLTAFMQNIVCDRRKQVSLSQCIVQASRPRTVISPIPFGVGVSLDHVFGSQWLLNTLSRLGLCASYDEVYRFKQSVQLSEVIDLPTNYPDAFTQFSGDNVDHNIATLDGSNSFHGMGIISMSTPCHAQPLGYSQSLIVPRHKRVEVERVVRGRGVPIVQYESRQESALSRLKLTSMELLREFFSDYTPPCTTKLNLMWHAGFHFQSELGSRPNWSGFVQDVSVPNDAFHPVSDIRLLPIIDLNPSDMTCIYSTLLFVEQQASLLNMPTACITFDQPLYIKAVEISSTSDMNVVCRLGGFHLLMNFLGAIGQVMQGSGLVDALSTCYGAVTITHMMTGKAYSRSLRGHYLVESALTSSLIAQILGDDTSNVDDADSGRNVLSAVEVNDLRSLYVNTINRQYHLFEREVPAALLKLESELQRLKVKLSENNRTAKLWVQYLDHIGLVKAFLQAERTGNWKLHLHTVSKMLNVITAAGHTHYTKSCRVYLQQMLELSEKNKWLHGHLSSGKHCVRRSDRYWSGISTDLAIEQCMMRELKSRGGLTHGRGMTENVRLNWVETMPICALVHTAVTRLTNYQHSSSADQHDELGKSRVARDSRDLSKIVEWFGIHSPFKVSDGRLRSLSSGIAANDCDGVNCDEAESVGEMILQGMDNKLYQDCKIRKIECCKTLANLSGKVMTGDKNLPVDPAVLFSRLIIVLQRQPDIQPLFNHELTALPSSFFKDNMMRKADKAVLAKQLTSTVSSCEVEPPIGHNYVVDGGWLLHKVKWQPGCTYGEIATHYTSFIRKRFGHHVTVVFDGYGSGATIKDHEHQRRATSAAPDVVLESTKTAYFNQASFLGNDKNKQAFVSFLMNELEIRHCSVKQAHDDADTLIVKTTLDVARVAKVSVVANDTDVLVLLVYHIDGACNDILWHSEVSSRGANRVTISSVKKIRAAIGDATARKLLVLHAVSGCDTTSVTFGVGKLKAWKKFTENISIGPLVDMMESPGASHEDIHEAGLKLLVILCGGKDNDSLNALRYTRYIELTTTSTHPLRPERLPPTESAARFHSYRVHLQVMQWKTLMTTDLQPESWGWQLNDKQLCPVATDLPAAPECLLKIMRCCCKTTTLHPCSTLTCTCIKNGLLCVAACKHCKGSECENASVVKETNAMDEITNLDDVDVEVDDYMSNCNLEDVMTDDNLELSVPWLLEVTV